MEDLEDLANPLLHRAKTYTKKEMVELTQVMMDEKPTNWKKL